MIDAANAIPAAVARKRIQSSCACAAGASRKAGARHRSASDPVTTPPSRFQSWPEICWTRANHREFATAKAVQAFQASNDKLVEGLERMEASLRKATARSDEQLAYYVAQAREVIDLSIASQQGLVDNLRQLAKPAKLAVIPAAGEAA